MDYNSQKNLVEAHLNLLSFNTHIVLVGTCSSLGNWFTFTLYIVPTDKSIQISVLLIIAVNKYHNITLISQLFLIIHV